MRNDWSSRRAARILPLVSIKHSIAGFALVVASAACSSGNDSPAQSALPVCGNGVLDLGEQCDGQVVPSCAMVTGNPLATGVVACVACRIDASACLASGTGASGAGATNAGGANGTAGFTGTSGFTGAGGFTANGGGIGSGGGPGNGGFFASGGGMGAAGFPPTGGNTGSGGVEATGGVTASGGASSTGGSPSSGPLGDVNALRQACVDTINQYRATLSLPPLTRAIASVEACSDAGAESDATAGVAHGSAGKCPGMGAQNTCPGWPPGQYGGVENAMKACLQSMWAEGEPPEGRTQCIQEYFSGNTACFLAHGHYLNMSSTDNTVVSCGFYVMPDGKVWMNQDFGH